jgi:CDP-2,3-bis-(O-geranylgeranyl)-sn-glycerol synthase
MAEALYLASLLLLLWVANGAPIIAAKIFGHRFASPLDGGLRFIDQRPLFGKSKTWRGVLAAVVCTFPVALLSGMEWGFALAFPVLAMGGDLCSSFVKRRLKIAPSSRAVLLDQIPESLLPVGLLVVYDRLPMSQALLLIAAFVLSDVVFSRILYRWHIRRKPY